MRFGDDARLAYRYAVSVARFATGAAPAPFSASFAVTDRCNLECGYCSCPYADHTDIPLADVARLFDRFDAMGVCRLGLVGGEPMLRKDLADVIALAKAHRFVVCVNTNLTLYRRFPERLAGVDLVFASLDGDADAHRAARGADAYDGVLDPDARCAAGRAFLYVDPRGNAFPCPYTRTSAEPVNLLRARWEEAWNRETPCTRCNVGPMVEFNLLVRNPLASALDVWRSYPSA